jgi:hypothetical protein
LWSRSRICIGQRGTPSRRRSKPAALTVAAVAAVTQVCPVCVRPWRGVFFPFMMGRFQASHSDGFLCNLVAALADRRASLAARTDSVPFVRAASESSGRTGSWAPPHDSPASERMRLSPESQLESEPTKRSERDSERETAVEAARASQEQRREALVTSSSSPTTTVTSGQDDDVDGAVGSGDSPQPRPSPLPS